MSGTTTIAYLSSFHDSAPARSSSALASSSPGLAGHRAAMFRWINLSQNFTFYET